ncbi:MAG: DUF1415 domain-containing protein [Gammaproteobacteria bacterium]|nr:DUF1415 domain-containing protein [Gammaproteobacteria bacterium]
MNAEAVVTVVRRWVEDLVVGLELCPFAGRELVRNRVRFAVTEAATEARLLQALESELALLNDNASIETTLLIHPNALQDFFAYNQFLDDAECLLLQSGLEGVYQVASFHPNYRFAGTAADDAENFTNRSPYPLLHILREASLERSIAAYPDVDQIPARNIAKMNSLESTELQLLLEDCFKNSK